MAAIDPDIDVGVLGRDGASAYGRGGALAVVVVDGGGVSIVCWG